MGRSLAAALAFAMSVPLLLLPPSPSRGSDRTLPMHFELQKEGPAATCAGRCRLFISASGAITAETPRDFESFAQDRDLSGAIVVLDSDGGSVHGAIALGREIRKLGLDATVGRLVAVDDGKTTPADDGLKGEARVRLSPTADCESMCAFVLVAGVHRFVPPQARVMVHQIWLGDRREDPTAASYSAEDLVLVQRDIGRLARYTADMGASVELLDLALRIPPWEPMHTLTRLEIEQAHVATMTGAAPVPVAATTASPAPQPVAAALPRMTDGLRAAAITEQHWAVVDHKGLAALARRHPLTIAGEDIGNFDLVVTCGASSDSYDVSYIEHRHDGSHTRLPRQLGTVTLSSATGIAHLKVVSSERRSEPDELVSYASASVPAKLIGSFASAGDHSIMVTTDSGREVTAIRLGNTGARQNLPRLAAACHKAPSNDRAMLAQPHPGGLASAAK